MTELLKCPTQSISIHFYIFITKILYQMMLPPAKYHFTEASLFSDIFMNLLKKSNLKPFYFSPKQSPEKDIFIFQLAFQDPVLINKQAVHTTRAFQIKIIQLQFIIKFVLVEVRSQKMGESREMCMMGFEEKSSARVLIEELWIGYKQYLPNRINSGYLLSDIKLQNLTKIQEILEKRIIKNMHMKQNKDMSRTGQLLVQALNNNFIQFNKLLKPKEYLNVQLLNSQIYKCLHTQINYQAIYEGRWGRTGFQLNERNWVKAYENKMKNMKKMGKI